jgi:putative peptidoglycan lipid II flippase
MTKERSLIRNTAVVGAGTFLSRITGLIREILVSSMFGASWVTDVFFVAYTIPNLLRRLFAEGALSTSVIPVFSQYSEKSHDESQKFIYSIFTGLTLVVSVVCVIGIAFSPWIVEMVGVGFRSEPDKIHMAINMTRIMFPFLLIISWSALVMGILNTLHIFSWSAIAPVFFNAGTILTLLLLRAYAGPYSLAIGVLIGGIGQFVIQLYPFYKKGFVLKLFRKFWQDPGFREVIRLMLPVTLALAVGQINTLVDRIIASTCQEGEHNTGHVDSHMNFIRINKIGGVIVESLFLLLGWSSPIGIGIFLLCLGGMIYLLTKADTESKRMRKSQEEKVKK